MAFTLVKASNIDTAANLSFASASLTGTLGVGGLISSTTAGQFFDRQGTSTSFSYMRIRNTSGDMTFGGEGSAGGALASGTAAYSVVLADNSGAGLNIVSSTGRAVTSSTGLAITGTLSSTGAINKLATGDSADVTLQLGADSPATNRSTRIAFLSATSGAAARNWFINTNWNTAGSLDFAPSTANGGTTMGSSVVSISTAGILSNAAVVNGGLSKAIVGLNQGSGVNTGAGLWLGYDNGQDRTVGLYGFYDGIGVVMSFATSPNASVTNHTERMRLDSAGRLLIGTTSSTAGYALKVGGANANILISADSPNGATLLCDSAAAGSKPAFFGHITSVAQAQVRCGSSGGVYLSDGATSWAAISDETQKDIIEPITDALKRLSTWRTVIGKYKTDENGVRRPFLIAQDVKANRPEAVDDGEVLGLRYAETIPDIIAAINELAKKIIALEDTK